MAYPTVSAPYGFQPINRIGGNPYAGSTRLVPVDSGAMYTGDLVELLSSGKCAVVADGTAAPQALGVCVGVQYTNSSGQTVQAQYYPTGVTNAVAYVVVDPQAAFKVAVTTSGNTSTVTYVTRAAVGTNIGAAAGTGSNTTGDSGLSVVSGTAANTAVLPFRVVDVVPETAINSTAFREVIVKLNQPQLEVTLGNSAS